MAMEKTIKDIFSWITSKTKHTGQHEWNRIYSGLVIIWVPLLISQTMSFKFPKNFLRL